MGHEVIEFDYDLAATFSNLDKSDAIQMKFIKKNRPVVSEAILKQISHHHRKDRIDLFFSYFYDACITKETIEEIKHLRIKTVNWYCNASYQLDLVSEISPIYDWCLVPEKFRLDDYRALGANPIYCQEAASENFYKPYDLPKEYDVSFVGQCYGERPNLIKYLFSQGIPTFVFGYGWKNLDSRFITKTNRYFKKILREFSVLSLPKDLIRFVKNYTFSKSNLIQEKFKNIPAQYLGGVLSDTDVVKTFSKSKINLGFSSVGDLQGDQRILQIRLRDFEVPMSGGFYLVEYMQELEEFFKIGSEIECYKNREELVDKINFYLKNDSLRNRIASKGRERCLRDHTWKQRFQLAFKTMGFLNNPKL